MQGSRLGLIAAVALLAGSAGCSLPHALPLAGGTTAGPSPYGVWYEQHWATNSVLLAAADQPDEEVVPPADSAIEVSPDTQIGEAPMSETGEYADPIDADAEAAAREARQAADDAAAAANAAATASSNVNVQAGDAEQFDDSSPYQFPASSFAPGTGEEVQPQPAVPSDGPIRY